MAAALVRPLPIGLLPINRPAAAAAGRNFSDSLRFQCVLQIVQVLIRNHCFCVKPCQNILKDRLEARLLINIAIQH